MIGRRVLVCGGRDFADKRLLMDTLAQVEADRPIDCVIEGGARGADTLARKWAEWRGIAVLECPANWSKFGKAAGGIRNQWMLDHGKPDVVVAMPGGRGTADMKARASKSGILVLEA